MTLVEGAFCPLETPRFMCDEMLQGLGEWLRVAGYDTLQARNGSPDRDVLARAVEDDRWLVTCDRELLLHRDGPTHVILLTSDGQEANIRELTRRLDLDWLHRPFCRCKRCNTLLETGPLPDQPAPDDRPDQQVYHCPECRQTYWVGGHVRRMNHTLQRFNRWRRSEAQL